jgi:signal transduction histidine kinase
MIENLVAMHTMKAKSKKIYLNLYKDPNLPNYILADSNRLSQVIVNFISNSVKFTQSGGVNVKVKWL